ncbi:MAG: four helix bundle protein [Proteobacteria bacterium]|nr:four helix bundle protein [Pseudomonadota bacterium]
MFMFENLDVYKKSVEFTIKVRFFTKKLMERDIKDQLNRAVLSIPLNIAEGNGRNTPKEKAQFFKTARGSLFECVPLLEICHKMRLLQGEAHKDLYDIAERIGQMLNGLINSLEK